MINPWIIFILILFLSYVIGSTPTSIIVGKVFKRIDIRKHGSGNAGGTNVFRVLDGNLHWWLLLWMCSKDGCRLQFLQFISLITCLFLA